MSIVFTEASGNISAYIKMNNAEILTERGIRKAWFAVGKDLIRELNTATLARPRSGRLYVSRNRAGRRRNHRASRPGESHANMSGTLRKSAGWKVRGHDLEFGYGVTKPEPTYAGWVENGTSKMAARPSVKNSINTNERNTEQHLLNAVTKEFTQ